MSGNTVECYFKQAFTTNTSYYNINPEWTITEFIEQTKVWIIRDYHMNDFELVLMGQSQDEQGLILQAENIRIKDKFPNTIMLGFYIRPIISTSL